MGRYHRSARSRSYSPRRRTPTPPPPSRRRYDDPRGRRHDDYRDRRSNVQRRRSPAPCGLLVRNISLDSRPEDLRIPFERFGPVKDVYLPKNYYTGEPRGFGFVKFRNPEDAAEAKHELNHCVIGGREIAIVFAEENRKTPREMRSTSQISGRHGGGSVTRRTPPRSSRRRSYSRSLSPARRDYSDRGRNEHSRSSISPPPPHDDDDDDDDGRRHKSRRSSPGGNGSDRGRNEHSRSSISPPPPPHDDDDGRRHKSRRSSPGRNGRGSMYTDQRGSSHDKPQPLLAQDWKSNEAGGGGGGGRLSRSRSRSRSPPPY
ncbi:putative RNA recognition motif domain, nucleotide-binding alpha-beta plait domain superfamily [Helianthus annuus]|uniref:Putative nucleotide-binding alpha-beta plait domain-containing protein n=1 Tax=Helianthus annuus TaxID=4232 RepID=A0A251TX74_HELAN|nr:serine/arginine-rich SC35-like splicing factor SCL28 isoform X1 [Helianthus annuus]KAF5791149.1 putative RNA recognition motif domain, nucleotide-binding alpha-beta plait domain superfamily [Helianthus annuus]KAJ0542657.1 putative RNA recognition motif domain, nucleotide-binding alpha-beta plait domain superfamily [Helianthus annuus]